MLGIDIVGIERFRAMLRRSPNLRSRFFTQAELAYCDRASDRVASLAGTLAAKEAVMKALDLTPAPAWSKRIEITRNGNGVPIAKVGDQKVAISISHDGGFAVAVAVASIGSNDTRPEPDPMEPLRRTW